MVWSDPKVHQLAERFVLVADEGVSLPMNQGRYHPFLKEEHNQVPEGIFMSASGKILVEAALYPTMAERMERALDAYRKLTADERLLPDDYQWPDPEDMRGNNSTKAPPGFPGCKDDYPTDGLVLHAYYRDLPRESYEYLNRMNGWNRWVRNAWNQDFVWFQKDEMLGFLPATLRTGTAMPQKGEQFEIAHAVVIKLARHHLKDLVSGREPSWPKEAVSKAELVGEVTEVQQDGVSLRLHGATRMYHEGSWGVGSNQLHIERGFDVQLLGKAMYSRDKNRFIAFDLLAVGTRWGAGPSNMRLQSDDQKPNPMGILFTLAGDSPQERVRPNCDYSQ